MTGIRQKVCCWILAVLLLGCVPVQAKVLDRIVAVVNNDIITLRELSKVTEPYRQKIEAAQVPDSQKKEQIASLQKQMLDQLVDASLAKQEAEKYGITVSESDVDHAIDGFKKSNNLDDESLKTALAADGMTLADYRKRMQEQMLQSMLVNRTVRSKIIVTDEDIKAYYDAHRDAYTGLRKYHLRNIVVSSRESMDKVLSLLGGQADFKALAKAYSEGSNAGEGGDLGLFDLSSFSPEIKDAVQGLEKGQWTDVLNTGTAFQILYVDDIVTEGNETLEQAGEKIRQILYQSQGETKFKEWMAKLKKKAHIKIML